MDRYEDTYVKMTDEELLRLALQTDSLTENARIALEAELRRRGIGESGVHAYQEQVHRAEMEEKEKRAAEKAERRRSLNKALKEFAFFLSPGILAAFLLPTLAEPVLLVGVAMWAARRPAWGRLGLFVAIGILVAVLSSYVLSLPPEATRLFTRMSMMAALAA